MNRNSTKVLSLAWLKVISIVVSFVSASAHAVPHSPIGYLDIADTTHAQGWTCDADGFSVPLYVHFYRDDGVYIGGALANIQREPAVAAACGGYAAHGFYWTWPLQIRDGKPHQIHAFAIDTSGLPNPELTNSPSYVSIIPKALPSSTGDLYRQESVSSINGRAFACEYNAPVNNLNCHYGSDFPIGTTFGAVFGMGSAAMNDSILWHVGDFTGFQVNPADGTTQRGAYNSWYGSTAIQMQGSTVGLHLHTWSSGVSAEAIANEQIAYIFPSATNVGFVHSDSALNVGFYAMIPSVYMENGTCGATPCSAVGYSYFNLTFMDPQGVPGGAHLRQFSVEVGVFDTRGLAQSPESWGGDIPGSGVVYYGDGVRRNSPYFNLSDDSASFASGPFGLWQHYSVTITKEQISMIIQQLNSNLGAYMTQPTNFGGLLRSDPSVYRLSSISFQDEIARPTAPVLNGILSVTVSGLSITESYGFR